MNLPRNEPVSLVGLVVHMFNVLVHGGALAKQLPTVRTDMSCPQRLVIVDLHKMCLQGFLPGESQTAHMALEPEKKSNTSAVTHPILSPRARYAPAIATPDA